MRFALLSVLCVAAACGVRQGVDAPAAEPTPPPPRRDVAIRSADQLIAAMHERYARQWYRSMTFTQKSTYLRRDGSTSRVETWYEAMLLPGRLRIDLGDPARGTGVLYRADSIYSFQDNRLTDRREGRNPLLVLGFDVYAQPPARTLAQLRAERIDLNVLRIDSIAGRRAYVVGAGPTDSTTNQFWIDADRLVFLRLIQTDPEGRRTRDIRFEKYVPHGGGWVAEEVRVLVDGRMIFHEAYEQVRVNVPLDEKLFEPSSWSSATHWMLP